MIKHSLLVLLSLFMLWVGTVNAAPEMPDTSQFVEPPKTNTMIEFDAKFSGCKEPMRFKARNGAMNTLSLNGHKPIRFIVKADTPDDIRLYPVTPQAFKTPDGIIPGLAAV
ncbi:MAG: hypothetical protein HOO93_12425 [Methyloglobulus sp.]|nr:hypothetical protein [Methyloglobulus sp.]